MANQIGNIKELIIVQSIYILTRQTSFLNNKLLMFVLTQFFKLQSTSLYHVRFARDKEAESTLQHTLVALWHRRTPCSSHNHHPVL